MSGILGQAAWATLIEGYLEAHPPRSFTLRDLRLRLRDELLLVRRFLDRDIVLVRFERACSIAGTMPAKKHGTTGKMRRGP